ncbi:TPA: glycosyltransferase [Proteus mirabilis]
MHMKIVINASNLHVGGGVQVAASFINEVYELFYKKEKIPYHIVVSNAVYKNISTYIDINKFLSFNILDIYGMKKNQQLNTEIFSNIDILFSIFGPFYLKNNAKIKITGFAQPWIIYPKSPAYNKLSILNKIKYKVKFSIQEFYFKKDTLLVVELEHVKKALLRRRIKKNDDEVSVVYNAVASIFDNPKEWKQINYKKNKFTLGFLGKPYPHKNIKILSKVSEILKNKYHISCDFLFTLTDVEMNKLGFNRLDNFYSIGPISVNQCPSFYKAIDALIFPSLLECFSVTPIEAMKMSTLVIASNLPFVSDICKDSALYFDPLDPSDIAKKISYAINNKDEMLKKIKLANNIVNHLPSAKDRALAYLNIIDKFKNVL